MIMRSQGCTIQQALTPEAAAVVKQAVGLAKRRGHAQVTPLHVAHTMLSGSSSGLFRAACLQAHSHPLQCRALELCFNVALQRLPTSTTVPMLGPISSPNHQPAIANALVAAFKRAQAHQRRGVIENNQQQQPPILAVKIELEQLIISILDDPSVSRVMREAGFSSPLVKSKVEEALSSMELSTTSQNQLAANPNPNPNPNPNHQNDDVKGVIDSLMGIRRKRNTVVIGERLETLECVVKQVMERVEKGEVPENLKGVKFIKVSLPSFGHLSREEVEQRFGELNSLIKGYNNINGVILYLDDLKWAIEFRATNNNIAIKDLQRPSRWKSSYYCPIEQVIMEIGKLVSEYLVKVWILGIATLETYMRCKSGEPSLESIWDLHAITIPSRSFTLSLIPHSDLHLQIASTSKKKLEFQGIGGCNSESATSSLPPWLQKYKDEKSKSDRTNNNDDQDSLLAKDLTRWSSFCNSTTSQPSKSFERSLSFTSNISPSSTLSFSPYDNHYLNLHPTFQSYEPKNFWANEVQTNIHEQRLAAIRISSNPSSSTPTPTSSSEIKEQIESQCALAPKFNEYNTDNLKVICNALEQKAPSQKDIIFDIASTILHCRSGKAKRKGNNVIVKDNIESRIKEDTWLFFEGGDIEAKEKIARELGRLIFGSEDKFVSMGISSFSSSRADSLEDSRNKRQRDEQSCSFVDRFVEAISSNPHRVFFVEDLEQVDYSSQIGFKKAIEGGRATKYSNGEEVSFCDAIIILSCERFSSKSRACSPSTKLNEDDLSQEGGSNYPSNKSDDASLEVSTTSLSISLDLNISLNCGEEDEDEYPNIAQGESRDEIGLLGVVDKCVHFKIGNYEL